MTQQTAFLWFAASFVIISLDINLVIRIQKVLVSKIVNLNLFNLEIIIF